MATLPFRANPSDHKGPGGFELDIKAEGVDELIAELREYEDEVGDALAVTINKYATDMERHIRTLISKPGSGRVYGKHRASAPGEPPATDTGDLISSIRSSIQPTEATIVADEKYAIWLEAGTSKMKPRPFFDPTVEKFAPTFAEDLQTLVDAIKN